MARDLSVSRSKEVVGANMPMMKLPIMLQIKSLK